MRKISILLLTAALAVSCSDFLDKTPLTKPNSETYLSGETQVYSYINGLYIALPTYGQYGMGPRGVDKNSDNLLSEDYERRLNGEYNAFNEDAESIWSTGYQNLRDVNYFFEYYLIEESSETDAIRSLKGEAYFFRAYWHFYLLKNFGDIPYMDSFWDGNATLEGLQIAATPRYDVAKKILGDLETAIGLLYPRSTFSGLRVNREAALVLAMNVALYEGTWEKYHASDDFKAAGADAGYFLEKVLAYGDELFKCGITLNTKDNDPFGAVNTGDPYAHLFNQKDYSNVPEALFWRKYSTASGVTHYYVNLIASGASDAGSPAGVSKSLVDNYLNADGTFIDPDDVKFHDFNEMFKGRDARLTETVMSSGRWFRSSKTSAETRPLLVTEYTEETKDKVNPPTLTSGSEQRNITGFHIALGIDTTLVTENAWDTGYIIIRYAEALLDYAEAAEELGKCDNSVLEKTLKPLRERAGVTWKTPVEDPNFKKVNDFGYDISPNMQEIRRERRSELALQGFRLDDILRWRAHNILKGKRGLGAYLGEEGDRSVLFKSFNPEDQDDQELLKSISLENGWIDPLKGLLPDGYRFDENRDYLLPISPDELNLNKKLKQNPGWD